MRRFAAACGIALAALATASAPAAAIAFADGFGLHIRSVRTLDSRLISVSLASSVIPGPANVRILLPTGYASQPHRRYGVLYLLHGTSGSAADGTVSGGAEQTTAGRPLIVVMPDIGLNGDGGGWCTNWVTGAHERWKTSTSTSLCRGSTRTSGRSGRAGPARLRDYLRAVSVR